MKNRHIVFWQEGKFWVAKCLENSIASQGLSYEEAKRNIKEALEISDDSQDESYKITNLKTEVLSF